VDNADYMFNDTLHEAPAQKDAKLAERTKREYLQFAQTEFAYFVDDALADSAYATPDRFVGTAGISWMERWRVFFGQKADYEHAPDPPEWVMKRFREIRRAAANQ